MTAKEMFEKLGYLYKQDEKGIYIVKFENARDINTNLIFNLKGKYVTMNQLYIDKEQFKAIQKQIEELRW